MSNGAIISRESGPTSIWYLITSKLGNPSQERMQDDSSQRNIFHTYVVKEDGTKFANRILEMASIPIRRHVKVKKAANPYDPAWEMYFEERQYKRILADLEGRPRLRHQWRMQLGICPSAASVSPKTPDGTTITFTGGFMAGVTT